MAFNLYSNVFSFSAWWESYFLPLHKEKGHLSVAFFDRETIYLHDLLFQQAVQSDRLACTEGQTRLYLSAAQGSRPGTACKKTRLLQLSLLPAQVRPKAPGQAKPTHRPPLPSRRQSRQQTQSRRAVLGQAVGHGRSRPQVAVDLKNRPFFTGVVVHQVIKGRFGEQRTQVSFHFLP